MREYLLKGLEKAEIKIENLNIDKLLGYLKHLKDVNSRTNLTAIRDDKEIIEKHFIDSLFLTKFFPKNAKNAIDIGTGAGFPGMVLAIAMPDVNFTLTDSIEKKTSFLREVKELLELENVEVITARSEELIKEGKRESFDVGLCRGVAELRIILEYVVPFIKENGIFLSQKMSEDERSEAENAFKILNSKINKIHKFNLPYSNDKRVVIEIEKTAKTDEKYPRRAGIAVKRPL